MKVQNIKKLNQLLATTLALFFLTNSPSFSKGTSPHREVHGTLSNSLELPQLHRTHDSEPREEEQRTEALRQEIKLIKNKIEVLEKENRGRTKEIEELTPKRNRNASPKTQKPKLSLPWNRLIPRMKDNTTALLQKKSSVRNQGVFAEDAQSSNGTHSKKNRNTKNQRSSRFQNPVRRSSTQREQHHFEDYSSFSENPR